MLVSSETSNSEEREEPSCRLNVTYIIKHMKPQIEDYLYKLVRKAEIVTTQVHRSFKYEQYVREEEAYPLIGLFHDYLIRREISYLLGQEAIDKRAEIIKKDPDYYKECVFIRSDEEANELLANEEFTNEIEENKLLVEKLLTSYKTYQDKEKKTFDIIEDIYTTSLCTSYLFDRGVLPYDPRLINQFNVKCILRWVQSQDLEDILSNPDCSCEYFNADADLIFKDNTLLCIRTSRFKSLKKDHYTIQKSSFYQLIFYAVGFYLGCGREIRKLKMYNALLGFEYMMELPDLDFTEFEKFLKKEDLETLYLGPRSS